MWSYVLAALPFVIVLVALLHAAIVTPTAIDLADLTALLATAPYTGMKMHLSTNNFVPAPNNVLTDYSSGEATFVGYTAQTITFGAPYIDPMGNAVATALVSFLATAGTTPNSIYTCYATTTAGSALQFGSVIDNGPRNIVNAGDGLSLLVTINLSDGTIAVVG